MTMPMLTQPILLAQIREWGIEISAGQLSWLLTEGHDPFHQEKALIKTVGLWVSSYVLVYMAAHGVAAGHVGRLMADPAVFTDADAWVAYLRRHLIDSPRAIALGTEEALLGRLVLQPSSIDG